MQHTKALKQHAGNKAAKLAKFKPVADTVQLLDRRQSVVYTVPLSRVIYAPDTKRLVLCERFDPADPSSCRFNSSNCRFVHADIRGLTPSDIHVAFAYTSPDACIYQIHEGPEGTFFPIREPASAKSNVVDQVLPCLVLKTRCVFNNPKRPAFRCAHFYYGRECHLGSKCDFAHVMHINPNAQVGDKAPLPSQIGRGRSMGEHSGLNRQDTTLFNGASGDPTRKTSLSSAALEEQYHQHTMPSNGLSNNAPVEFSEQYYAARAKHTGQARPTQTPTADYLAGGGAEHTPMDNCFDHTQLPPPAMDYGENLDYNGTGTYHNQGGGFGASASVASLSPNGPQSQYPYVDENAPQYCYDADCHCRNHPPEGRTLQSPAVSTVRQRRWQHNPYATNQGTY